jgi:catechol 2,3-dioxygenase-like lactoylglutathione lyase family enzyme
MPIIKVADMAFVRVRVPDLDQAEQFLSDFGLIRAERLPNALYMRGTGTAHHAHIAELGEPKFLSLAFAVAKEADLHTLSQVAGASAVEPLNEPGGGLRVTIKDPDGNLVEVVHGLATVDAIAHEVIPLNDAKQGLRRAGALVRHVRRPAKVLRLGHAVLMSTNSPAMVAWYRETLGLLCSDEVIGPDNQVALSFNRLDRGDEYVDHHVLLIETGPKKGLNHVAYEIQDIDDLMLGHDHLMAKGYESVWGIGRHVYGGQVFDYWMDAWDFMYEHWTDTDRVNAQFQGVTNASMESANGPWGAQVTERFFLHAHD